MKRVQLLVILALSALSLLPGCKTKVDRIAADEAIDLSGRWNDTDSQLVSKAMIEDLSTRPWIEQFALKNGRNPS